jgi:hypothetical protein
VTVLVDDVLKLFDSAFVLLDDRKKTILKVLEQRNDGFRTGFVCVQDLRGLNSWQTVLGLPSHEKKHHTVFPFPEA